MAEWKKEITRRLVGLRLDPTRELEIVEELSDHLEDRYEELIATGISHDEAYRVALSELSDNDLLRREFQRVERREADNGVVLGKGGRSMIADFRDDLRYGTRILLKNPGFTIVAVLTLALGIGSNTAIFSVVHAVLLSPLPYAEPDRLVILGERDREGDRMGASYPNYKDWHERARSFQDMAAVQGQSFNLTGVDRAMRLQGRRVSWNFFQILGVSPQLGRSFTEQDDSPGVTPTALISNGLWKGQFGGDQAVLGRTIKIDGIQYTIIGVMPPGFEYFRNDDLYVPLGLFLLPQTGILDRGNHFGLYGLARLKSGISVEQAREEMRTLAAQLEQEYPNTNSGNSAMAENISDVLVEDIRPPLIVLLVAVGFVLLIACVNVANLMLVRAAERQKEIALRLALGASRGRVIRQLLSESLLISSLGGGAGLFIGTWAVSGLVALAPPDVPRLAQVSLNGTVLAFTLFVSALTGLLFGLFPAVQASMTNLQTALKEGGRTSSGTLRERTRKVLLVAEVGLALVLLIGAGLMLRTVSGLMNIAPGFDARNLLTVRFILSGDAYNVEKRRTFYTECLERVGRLPGVESAALTLSLPIEGSNWNSVFVVADKPVPPRSELPSSAFIPVSVNYFETLGIRLLRGRAFTEADNSNPYQVIVINETMANRFWPGEDAVGERVKQGWPESDTPWREIIGVVSDVKLDGIDRETALQIYMPIGQQAARSVALVARTGGDPLAAASTVEETIRSIDNDLPVFNTRSMDQLMGNAIGRQRLLTVLLASFAVLALTLAAVGIYGVMSYAVAQRTHEIGIRMAMGARPRDVLRLIVRQGMILTVVGSSIGLAAALLLTRLMESMLFGVSATDPATFAILTLLLAVVAFFACYLPARRATKVDPLVALRYE